MDCYKNIINIFLSTCLSLFLIVLGSKSNLTAHILAVLAKKGMKHIIKWECGMKTQTTVLGCTNAAGDYASIPHLSRPVDDGTLGVWTFHGSHLYSTENRWMDVDTFFEFICYFDAWIMELKITWLVILWWTAMYLALQHKQNDFVTSI